jgi:adenylate kinase family enzyme
MAHEISPFAHLDAPPRRVIVGGTTGSGKTTLAGQIAAIIGAPHVELDALHWEPNWTEAPADVFRERIAAALTGDRWVVDGNYSVARDLTWSRADLLIWLDYSLARIYWQLLRRTTRRVRTQEELWSGNRERFRAAFFSRESLFVWALQTHWKRRRIWPPLLADPTWSHLRYVHIRSSRDLRAFVAQLRDAADTPTLTTDHPASPGLEDAGSALPATGDRRPMN